MEAINRECYVSLEAAKLLEEAGFNWKVNTLYFSMQDDDYPIKEELIRCTDYFPNGDQHGTGNPFHNWNHLNPKRGDYYAFVSKKNFLEFNYETIKKDTTLISAPTLDVAQRWLREVKKYHISVFPETTYKEGIMYKFSIYKEDYDLNANHIYTGQTVKTYEVAQEAGIKKALKIILEKGE